MIRMGRRQFLKLGTAGVLSALFMKKNIASAYLPDFPAAYRLGRVFAKVDVMSSPDPDSSVVKTLFDDALVVINREVIGSLFNSWGKSRIWYETPEGFIPAISVQLVRNEMNIPFVELPNYGNQLGMWAEVTVPYVDIKLDGDTPFSARLKMTEKPRFYFSQILWVDAIRTGEDGNPQYHLIERYGNVDRFWADARAFKPLTPEDIAPISPEISDKYILIDLNHQTLSCYENGREVLFARISSGANYDYQGNYVEKWGTPVGDYHVVNRKYISIHMAGGEESKATGYEEFAVSWTSIFATGGVAIHSTYWHNNYGEKLSHGCVNADPDVAKFVFRWTNPVVEYEPGKIEVLSYDGTNVKVQEG